jgi:hypothetical protein
VLFYLSQLFNTYTNLTTFNQKHTTEIPDFCTRCRQQLYHFVEIPISTVGYQHEVTCFRSTPLHGCHENNAVHFCQLLYRLISITNFDAQFLYSLTICILHYNPRRVLSINTPIFRRTNCIITASGIVTLCKWLYSMPHESRLCML